MAAKVKPREGPRSPTGEQASLKMKEQGFAGPYLRYINIFPEKKEWRGSVLLLVRSERLGWNTSGAGSQDPPPTQLILEDMDNKSETIPEVSGILLDQMEGWQAWRFDIRLRLKRGEQPIAYTLTIGPITTGRHVFWVPGHDQHMHWGYTSCNGISIDVARDAPARQDPTYLWRDMLQLHDAYPLHCIYGGGDQVYNDLVWAQPALAAWGKLSERTDKLKAKWTAEMEAQAVEYYCHNYIDTLSTTNIATAMACIPQVMLWDDHDIWDGWGSYRDEVQATEVFQSLFKVARRFFLLFQKHTTVELAEKEGEYLLPKTYHSLHYLGPSVCLLSLDMRTNRTRTQCIAKEEYPVLKEALLALPSATKHIVIGSGIPVVWTSIPKMEWILRAIEKAVNRWDCCMALASKTGLVDKFDQPEILDDLHDGWMADLHQEERTFFIHFLQEVALATKTRVTILSGDAHVAGVGRLYSQPKFKNLENDPLFMAQITSSAIVNSPPPTPVISTLTRLNFSKRVDERTRQKMVKAFWPKHPRADKLLGQRNWCDITLCAPPFCYPMVASEAEHDGLRFVLRVEDPKRREGYADETYNIVVPRYVPESAGKKEGKAPSSAPAAAVAQAHAALLAKGVRQPAVFYPLDDEPVTAMSEQEDGSGTLEPHGALQGHHPETQ